MPKFAANLSTMFTEYPFLERFTAAAKAGFKGVEFLFPYDYPIADLKQALTDNRLEMVLFNTAPGDTAAGEWGISAIPGREQEARKHIDLALEYAVALGGKQIHIMAAVVPEGANREEYYATFIDNLRYAADRFAPHGINILLEALNPRTKPNYLYSSQYETLEFVKKVGKENIFTQLDLFHAQLVDGNLSHLISDYSSQYKHIQIASVPDRHEPDEGEINYPWIFDLIDKSGYTGWIGCEYLPRTTTLDGLGWFQKYQ